MGTRADFYVGRGADAEWLGSVAWDGNPESFEAINATMNEADYRVAVEAELSGRDDATRPADGWPWPWDDSGMTDYAYSMFNGKVWASNFGHNWFDPLADLDENEDVIVSDDPAELPNMSARKNVTMGKRSGVIVFGA